MAEDNMRQYIIRWVKSRIAGAVLKTDEIGNIYITKGKSDTYPCIVAHLDQVQSKYPEDFVVLDDGYRISGYSPSSRQSHGIGGDDKCGIWIALKTLSRHDAVKVAFFVGEEIGCQGSAAADMDFFRDVRFIIEPDRRGCSDLIVEIGGMNICSDEFLEDIGYAAFGYQPTHGMTTDVLELSEMGVGVSCINLSCGYYLPHTEDEYVVKEDMRNALDFVDHIVTGCTKVYAHNAYYKQDAFGGWGYGGYIRRRLANHTEAGMTYGASSRQKPYRKTKTNDFMTPETPDYSDTRLYDNPVVWQEYDSWEEGYDQELETARDVIEEILAYNPTMTANQFWMLYKGEYDHLSRSDIDSIFAAIGAMKQTDDSCSRR